MTPPLAGRHALVTGAGRGIGAAIARRLADAGATLTLAGRNLALLQARAAELAQARAHAVALDVTDARSVEHGIAAARDCHGPIAILVNNAGAAASAPFARTDDALWQQMLEVNATGAMRCTRAVLPDMQAAGWGRVINIASTAGLKGYPYVAAYVAAKHALVGLTRALALEVAKRGITVNAVCPGFTDTDLLEQSVDTIVRATGRSAAQVRAQLVDANPQGRFVQPDEVAATVAWLCGPESGALTGQALALAGGEVMG
jgi:NAD(P)-dependent dehydrogenase (short-subunit alcohol dehydrogenase family)